MGVANVATKPNRQQACPKLRLDRPVDGPGDGEIAMAVRCLDQLRNRLPGRLERGVQVPARDRFRRSGRMGNSRRRSAC